MHICVLKCVKSLKCSFLNTLNCYFILLYQNVYFREKVAVKTVLQCTLTYELSNKTAIVHRLAVM